MMRQISDPERILRRFLAGSTGCEKSESAGLREVIAAADDWPFDDGNDSSDFWLHDIRVVRGRAGRRKDHVK